MVIDLLPAQPDSEVLLNDSLQEQFIREALGLGKADEAVTKGYGIILQHQDLWTLKSHRWLNNQVSYNIVSIMFSSVNNL